MPDFASIRQATMLMMIGAVAILGLYTLGLWRSKRGHSIHLWSTIWSVISLVFIFGRYIQHQGGTLAAADLGMRIQLVGAFLTGYAAVGLLQSLAEIEPNIWRRAIGLAGIGYSVLALATDLLVTSQGHLREEPLGIRFYVLQPGPLLWTLIPFAVVAICYCLVLSLHCKFGHALHRQLHTAQTAMFGAAMLNDVLTINNLVTGVLVLDVAYFLVAVGFAFMAHQEAELRYAAMREEVSERDRELQAQTENLERSLRQLEQSEARFKLLADATVEGIAIHQAGRVLHANRALQRMFGWPTSEDHGGDLGALWAPESAAEAGRVVCGEIPGPVEVSGLRPDGTTFPAELWGSQTSLGGRAVGVVALRDLTERRRMERQLVLADRMASLGTLAAGVAHEVNNPLFYIMGNLEFMVRELDKPQVPAQLRDEYLELLAESREGCDRIRRIVQNLKSLSRAPEEDQGPADVECAINSSVRMAHNEIRHRARLVLEGGPVPPVGLPESQLGQVLLNLLVNAAQAIPTGQADRHRIAVRTSQRGQQVLIEVSDTGDGIPEQLQEKIFDPFFTTKEVGQGTGLGLSICHSIVTAAGGEIMVSSTPGQGATFCVSLPVAPQRADEPAQPERVPLAESPRARILVVDDEPFVGRTLCRLLGSHETTYVLSGQDAIRHCMDRRPDLVFCDLMMPDMGGDEVYEQVRRQDAELARRFVFMTGGAFTAETRRFLAGIDNLTLEKPVTLEKLHQAVRTLMEPKDQPPGSASETAPKAPPVQQRIRNRIRRITQSLMRPKPDKKDPPLNSAPETESK
jgi:PAS domain S-box-containing protein